MLSFCLWLSCRKLNELVSGFPVPSPHHVPLAQPVPLSPALLTAKFMFLREDALVQPLSPLYRGPSLGTGKAEKVLLPSAWRPKGRGIRRQVGTCLLPPTHQPSSSTSPRTSCSEPGSGSLPASTSTICWCLCPGPPEDCEVSSHWNPYHAARVRRICFAVPSGGSTVAYPRQPYLVVCPVFLYTTTTQDSFQDNLM